MQLTYEEAMNRGKGTCTYCGSEIMYTVPDHDDMRFGIVVYRCYSKLDTSPDVSNPYHTTMSNKCKALVDGKTLIDMKLTDQVKPYVPTATRPVPEEFNDTKTCPKCGSSFALTSTRPNGTYVQYACGTEYSNAGKLVSWHPTCRDLSWGREFNDTNHQPTSKYPDGIPQNNINVPQSVPRQSEASYLENAIRQAIDAMPIDPAESLRILREAIS